MVTDEMVRRAATEYLSHRGERPYRVTRRGAELWEDHAPAMRAALEDALSAAETRGYLVHDKDNPDGRYFKQKPSISDDDMSEYEIWIEPLYATPPAPSVAVKADLPERFEEWWTGRDSKGEKTLDYNQRKQLAWDAFYAAAISAQVQDVAGSVIKLGAYGRAYDLPEERRAYTYEHQPGNIEAHKLGRACSDIHSGGDWIDRGLNLLNSLQREGFGVFELPAAPEKQEGKP